MRDTLHELESNLGIQLLQWLIIVIHFSLVVIYAYCKYNFQGFFFFLYLAYENLPKHSLYYKCFAVGLYFSLI